MAGQPIKETRILRVFALNTRNRETVKVYVLIGKYQGDKYVFRFAYEDEASAREAWINGENNEFPDQSHELVVRLNYWRYRGENFKVTRHPSTKNGSYHLFLDKEGED